MTAMSTGTLSAAPAQVELGPDLAHGLGAILADPNGRACTLFRNATMAVRARYETRWPGYLDVLLLVTGELQLTVWRTDGAPWSTEALECLLFLDSRPVPLRDGGTYWTAVVPLDRIAGLIVTLACRPCPSRVDLRPHAR
jgi:hypothetical protein